MSEDNKKTEDLMKRAFRWPKFGVAQKLVSQHLVLSAFSSDANTIIEHVTQASSIVEGLGQKVEGLDFELMQRISAINRAISNFNTRSVKTGENYDRSPITSKVYSINFGFELTEENYKKYITCWLKRLPCYFPSLIRTHRQPAITLIHYIRENSLSANKTRHVIDTLPPNEAKEYYKWLRVNGNKCPICHETLVFPWSVFASATAEVIFKETTCVKESPTWSFFFEVIGQLPEASFNEIKTGFMNWAINECGKAKAVIGNLLSPNTFEETVKLLGNNINKKPERNNDF